MSIKNLLFIRLRKIINMGDEEKEDIKEWIRKKLSGAKNLREEPQLYSLKESMEVREEIRLRDRRIKIGVLIVVVLGIVLCALALLNFSLLSSKPRYPRAAVPLLRNIDTESIEIVSTNPDLVFGGINFSAEYVYERDGFMFVAGPEAEGGVFPSPSEIWYPWYGDGMYTPGPLPTNSARRGIIVIHPRREPITKARYWAQNISLPRGRLVLVASIGDIADYVDPCKSSCSDAIIKIKIYDHVKNKEDTIYEDVVDAKWKDVFLDISKYQNKNITLRIEGYAGGPCGEWCGEWAAVDKLYVGVVH
jgi:hypothetical protein